MNDFKRQLINMMAPRDHKHFSLTEALACKPCQPRVLKAKALYDREIRKDPTLIQRPKPEFKPSQELIEKREQLGDRLKRDKLYKEHIRKSFFGTPAESKQEEERANSGYYERHSDYQGIKFL